MLRAQPIRHLVAAACSAVAGIAAVTRAWVGRSGITGVGRGGLAWRGRTAVIASVSGINGRTAAVVAGIAGIGGRTRVGRRAAVPCAGL